MRARYLKDNFWTLKIDYNASTPGKNILKKSEQLKESIERQIALGENTDLWRDPWLNSKCLIDRLGWTVTQLMALHQLRLQVS